LLDRLVARVADEPARREELVSAFMQARWDLVAQGLDRSAQSASAQSQAWAAMLERLLRVLQRGSKQWSAARKKDSLQRVLDGSRSDMQRLQQRLGALVGAWESDAPLPPGRRGRHHRRTPCRSKRGPASGAAGACNARRAAGLAGRGDTAALTINAGLPEGEPRAIELADRLAALADRLAADEGPMPRACSSWTAPAARSAACFRTATSWSTSWVACAPNWARAWPNWPRTTAGPAARPSRCRRGWPTAEQPQRARRHRDPGRHPGTMPACAASASRRATRSSS
jgi:hypothetical protein